MSAALLQIVGGNASTDPRLEVGVEKGNGGKGNLHSGVSITRCFNHMVPLENRSEVPELRPGAGLLAAKSRPLYPRLGYKVS